MLLVRLAPSRIYEFPEHPKVCGNQFLRLLQRVYRIRVARSGLVGWERRSSPRLFGDPVLTGKR